MSPVPRAGTLLNGEACQVASPLSKSSSCTQNHPASSGGLLSYLHSSLDSQALIFGVSSPRSSRPLERARPKAQVWRRALFHFLICFVVGVFIGLTPFVSMNLSTNLMSKQQALTFEMVYAFGNSQTYDGMARNVTVDNDGIKNNATLESQAEIRELRDVLSDDYSDNQSLPQDSDLVSRKLIIIVTPTDAQPFQAYYLNRLAHTLRMVQPPLLWIVVEMTSQSEETADVLRRTGVMYRHLVCKKNLTDVKDTRVHQRNVALSHIENHHLDGIVYFADENNIYLTDLFEELRQIRRFGTWTVGKLSENKMDTILEGPICNGTRVIGWHVNEPRERFRRFHAEMSGFAFNSTILWDPKRWHRPTLEPIRQVDAVKDGFQASTFVEQIVEDESQMEGLLEECSRIMAWLLPLESSNAFYPQKWRNQLRSTVIALMIQCRLIFLVLAVTLCKTESDLTIYLVLSSVYLVNTYAVADVSWQYSNSLHGMGGHVTLFSSVSSHQSTLILHSKLNKQIVLISLTKKLIMARTPATNLDLILLAFLHGTFIACALLVVVLLLLIAMLLSFSVSVVSIVVIDLYSLSYSTLSSYFQTLAANLELGFVLILCVLTSQAIAVVSAAQPWYQRSTSNIKVKARRAMNRFDTLLLVITQRC
ncbi:putative beta-1,4-xylosyltransferase IRX9H [Citrus sinensis]|uniref:Beta-1,4-xylosyltransferase IRX9H n=1 Tax=Citrus sinensis TaxID=2711 RepID=A0ACB8NN78_CITSI|nr:putative beta-1,4-xylosyltransferase IRX9H [Citrus sinensis]